MPSRRVTGSPRLPAAEQKWNHDEERIPPGRRAERC